MKYTEGPWFVAGDDALDCPDHANSGLALVDTGRYEDWPIARLCEWNNALLISVAPQLVEMVQSLLPFIDSYCQASPVAVAKAAEARALLAKLD